MLKKLFLDQTKKYEQAIAIYEIAEMLVGFVQGRKHHLGVGAEQGDIKDWDDFVYETSNNTFIHVQVKRQQTNFSDKPCTKDSTKDEKLSTLDKSMQSLAKWIKKSKLNSQIKRTFVLELPTKDIQIKKELTVRQFRDFNAIHIVHATDAQGLSKLQNTQNDKPTQNIFNWLSNWCEFDDWEHILQALRVLTLKVVGSEVDILTNAEGLLKPVFREGKEVINRIKLFILDNTAYTATIKPRQLLFELKDYLLQNISIWTQFEKVDSHWNISGIHDLEFNDKIERTSIIVPSLWNNDNDRSRYLKIKSPVNDGCKFSESLMRLFVHQDGLVHTHCEDKNGWVKSIKYKTGGTIGIGKNDLDNLNVVENTEAFSTSEKKVLESRSEHESFSRELDNEMCLKTWRLVVEYIEKKINEMEDEDTDTELRDAVEQRWDIWKSELEKSADEQKKLFHNMLHPNAEGKDICGELRIGAKTTSLLVDGLFLLLIVAVCLDEDNEGDWKNITSSFSVNTIGLCFWSGPMGKRRKVREITDNGIEELIGKETADILIISKTNATAGDICNNDLTGDDFYRVSLASSNYPKLLVTNHIRLKRMIRKGKIIPLTKYLNSFIEKSNNSKQVAIQKAIS